MEEKYFGYVGKVLRIDLTDGVITTEPTSKYFEWLGGSGVGQWINFTEINVSSFPLAPENVLVFSTGPLTGTLAPASSRLSASSKSPVTSGVGSSSAGGYFAAELKYAGYDHIVITGISNKPVYIWINDGDVQIKDASMLWGKNTGYTDSFLKENTGSNTIKTLCIGPAGENLVRSSCIIVDRIRALGRCGMGTVMGSKKLKAIAVRGTGKIEVANPLRFTRIVDKILDSYTKSSGTAAHMKHGTLSQVEAKNRNSAITYKHWQDFTIPPEMLETFKPENIYSKYNDYPMSCFSCPLSCGKYTHVKDGQFAGLKAIGAQFEALLDFGGKMAVNDFSFVLKATDLCNELGLDLDAPGEIISWAMECYEKGLLTAEDFDGLKPTFGNVDVAITLINKIAFRQGVGDILAEGVAKAAETLGAGTEYYAMHIKGQELYEPMSFAVGWGLGACVSTRGGGHTSGSPTVETSEYLDTEKAKKIYGIDNFNKPMEFEGKEKLVYYYEALHHVNNSLGLCHFGTDWKNLQHPGFPEIAELYSAATGIEMTPDKLKLAGIRMLNVERAFNILHAKFDRKDDYPPKRLMEEPVKSGDSIGFVMDQLRFDKLLDAYYQLHGWDVETGYPKKETLESLDLNLVGEKLESAGKLR